MARPKGSKNKSNHQVSIGKLHKPETKPEPESKLRIVKVFATEETRLSNGVMKITGKIEATVSNNSKFFLQNHPRNVLVSQFSIHCKYIADPFNIDLEVINEVQYDAYIIEIGDHIADLIII